MMKALGVLTLKRIYLFWAERDRARDELAAINHELVQKANVQKFTTEDGEDQFWVEIDPIKKTGDADGKTWARMPRR